MIIQVLLGSTPKITTSFSRRPTSCTVELYSPANGVLREASSASLGISKTITDGYGINNSDPRELGVDSREDIEFAGRYLLVSQNLHNEFITVLSCTSNGTLDLAEPLNYDYVAGDTLESVDAYTVLTADETATQGLCYRARFAATMPSGDVETRDVVFDVMPHIMPQPITGENINQFDPLLYDLLPTEMRGQAFEDFLANTWRLVLRDILASGSSANPVSAATIMDERTLAEALLFKVRKSLADSGLVKHNEEYPFQTSKYYDAQYKEALKAGIEASEWIDKNTDLTRTDDEIKPIRKRRRF